MKQIFFNEKTFMLKLLSKLFYSLFNPTGNILIHTGT